MKEVASIFVHFVNHFAAHKSTLGVLNRASIFVNHFAASVSDSVTDSTLLIGFSISSQYLVH